MAGASLLTLLDDITTLLDDVSAMTKVAAKKTAGVLGDDLALNSEQLMGINPNRELPVVWAVGKGSMRNKFILVPLAVLIYAFLPKLLYPLLMLGGIYLCYEGMEKIVEKLLHPEEVEREKAEVTEADADPAVSMLEYEKGKIQAAIRTDFVLSAEIIVIALGTLQATEPKPTMTMVVVGLCLIAVLMTVCVYGLVAGIIKLDDLGFWLERKSSKLAKKVGYWLIEAAPYLMRFLSIAGTVAMFLVGGSIIAHASPSLRAWVEQVSASAGHWHTLVSLLLDFLIGVVVGLVSVAVMGVVHSLQKHHRLAKAKREAKKITSDSVLTAKKPTH